ncbi:hypothetical protein [Shimia sp.]|uniref:hypothetical protein n=1 Tax=Shimia sp. TaxID=1954381 RepID=UPI003B8AEFB7
MQRTILTTALLTALLTTTASAQALLDCSGLDPEQERDAYRAFECVSGLDSDLRAALSRIETLESQMQTLLDTVAQIDTEALIPANAVLAVDSPGRCPNGWSEFVEAQGRTIIGASFGKPSNLSRSADQETTQRKYRDHGGEERVLLTQGQMPKHNHTVTSSPPDSSVHDGFGGSKEPFGLRAEYDPEVLPTPGWETQHPSFMSAEGGDQAHNNMPPYIALYFCKKD